MEKKRDCAFLFADGQMKKTFDGFLNRDGCFRRLDTREFTFDAVVAATGDPGVYTQGHELIEVYRRTHLHAILVLDHDWHGAPRVETIQTNLRKKLIDKGWRAEDVEIIVIKPELEIWLWQDAPFIAEILRFNHPPHESLRKWLEAQGHWAADHAKPARPKEAFDAICRITKRPRSADTYAKIAQRISVRRCQDPAFCLLRDTLQRWFPPEGGQS